MIFSKIDFKRTAYISASFLLMGSANAVAQTFTNDKQVSESYQKSVDSLLSKVTTITATDGQAALAANTGPVSLNLLKPNKKILTGHELYEKAKLATVIVGISYICPRCTNRHLNETSGYIIDPKGIMVTNYHVASMYANMKDGNKPLGLTVRMANGEVFAVKNILTASKTNDLAVFELETNGKQLPALPLAEKVNIGDQICVLGHPKGMHYYFSQGYVNNKYMEETGEPNKKFFREMMAISADYATGSSGGPVMDMYGNVVATVSNTLTLMHSDMNPSVQMVLKNTVPIESLRKLVK